MGSIMLTMTGKGGNISVLLFIFLHCAALVVCAQASPSFNEAVKSAKGEADIQVLRRYLSHHHPDSERARFRNTLLILAAWKGNSQAVSLLVDAGADVNAKGEYYTALTSAAWKGHTDIVKMLLEKENIDVNIRNYWGNTALINAALYGYTDIVKMLLKNKNIDVNILENDGDSALGGAKNDEIKKMLEERNAVCRCVSEVCRIYVKNCGNGYVVKTAGPWGK